MGNFSGYYVKGKTVNKERQNMKENKQLQELTSGRSNQFYHYLHFCFFLRDRTWNCDFTAGLILNQNNEADAC